MSTSARAATAIAAVALAVVLFVVLSGDDDSDDGGATTTQATTTADPGDGASKPDKPKPKPTKPEVPTIVVEDGQPVGGVAELGFEKGETILFAVESDVADHVHLHGYDVFMDIPAGGRVKFDVPATIEGVFEVELEDRVVPLAEITVSPG
jgi:hypothetical protein